MTPLDLTSAITSNPGLTDRDLARVLGVHHSKVARVRQSIGIPPHNPTRADANIWLRCPQSTRTAVEALASAEGVTMSAWCAAAIVERMERVQARIAALREPDRLHRQPVETTTETEQPTEQQGDRVSLSQSTKT